MEKIKLFDKTFVPFIKNGIIEDKIDAVAKKLNEDYKDCKEPPVLLCVLSGAIMFCADLMKRLEFESELMTVKLRSYEGTESTGVVIHQFPVSGDVRGKRVIICEDIVDSGSTIMELKKMLIEEGASDVKICTLLLKPEVYKGEDEVDYVAISIENRFVVGFGLDYNQIGRSHKDIYVLEK